MAAHPDPTAGPPDRLTRATRRPVVGEEIALGTRHVSRAELLAFARDWDPQWFHVDVGASREGRFGDVIGSGIHTIGLYQRLAVEAAYAHWDFVAGLGFRDVRFRAPLRPDTEVTGRVRVASLTAGRRAEILVVEGSLDQVGTEPVRLLDITMEVMLGPGGR